MAKARTAEAEATTEATTEPVAEDTTQSDMLGAANSVIAAGQRILIIVQSTTDGEALKRLVEPQLDALQSALDAFGTAGEEKPEATPAETAPEPAPTPV